MDKSLAPYLPYALFVSSNAFQLTLPRLRSPWRGSRGNGCKHHTHLSSLLSYLAGERWCYPFPPPLMCLLLHLMPLVNMQLLDSHFSSISQGMAELCTADTAFVFPHFRRQTFNMFKVKSAPVRDYCLIALAGC